MRRAFVVVTLAAAACSSFGSSGGDGAGEDAGQDAPSAADAAGGDDAVQPGADGAAKGDVTTGCRTPDSPSGAKWVFVSTTSVPGGLGRDGADAICNTEALAAGLCGSYVAFLSLVSDDAWNRLPEAAFVNGKTLVFKDKASVTAATSANATLPEGGIAATADGGSGGGVTYWTGTQILESATRLNCSDWKADGGVNGIYGQGGATNYTWTQAGSGSCASSHHLLCFQAQ